MRLKKMKNTKSTYPIDLPNKLRNEFAPHLAAPLANIFCASLRQQVYPALWKVEIVTPVPKVPCPSTLGDLRKMSGTSDYSKLFEFFIKQWILEDVYPNIDPSQYGDNRGTGTEHMIVCFLDRFLKLLDSTEGKTAVIAASADWASAFDRLCPTICASKFIKLGLRPSLVPLIISYMSDRKMKVKFKGILSTVRKLIGGSGQGTILGQTQYIVASNDVCEDLDSEDKYRYIDDLEVLDLAMLSGLLIDYNFWSHVASDVGVDQKFLPPELYKTQDYLNSIQSWTEIHQLKLNEKKSNYIIFSRCQTTFTSRLLLNNQNLEQVRAIKLLGVWITEDLS